MTNNKLKIAVLADPYIPVPPVTYGGIERIIDFLVKGLIEQGHEVSLLAHPGSLTNAELVSYKNQNTPFKHLINIITVAQLKKFKPDIIHSFARLAYLLPFLQTNIPKIMSYQREPTISQIKKAVFLAKKNTLAFTGCSKYISDQISPYASAYPIYNGVDLSKYNFIDKVDKDAPLVFLGRIEPDKGTHIAIEVAQKTGKNLVIAGNIPGEYQSYFDEQVKPHLNDNISYIGPVNDEEKNILLGSAAAFLMPILWNEPFGIVMAEAMACGTPVIGFNKGSVPEIIINGVNGFSCDTIEEMVILVGKAKKINRKEVRADTEQRFSSVTILREYLSLYYKLIEKN